MKDGLNDLYTRDKMERNAVDYEGSGIGSGHYNRQLSDRRALTSLSSIICL